MTTIHQPRANLSAFGSNGPSAIESIGQMFENNFNNADARAKQALQNAQMQNYQSQADDRESKMIAEQAQQRILDQESRTLQDLFAPTLEQPAGPNGPGAPGMSITDKLNDPTNLGKINASMINLSLKAGKPSADIANLLRAVTANSAVPDNILARSVVGSGQLIGPNDALSMGGQANIRAGNVANEIAVNRAKPSSNTYILPPGADINDLPQMNGGSLYDNADKFMGPVASGSEIASNVAGFFGKDVDPLGTQARSDAKQFSTLLSQELLPNGRLGQKAINDLKNTMAIEPDTFTSPIVAQNKMIALDNTLSNLALQAQGDMQDPLLSKAHKSVAAHNFRAFQNARARLGVKRGPGGIRGDDNQLTDSAAPSNSGGWSVEEIQ